MLGCGIGVVIGLLALAWALARASARGRIEPHGDYSANGDNE